MYTTMFGDTFENEQDEEMSRKHGYNYGYLKYKYPDVCKLPEQEVKEMLDIVYEAPDMEKVDSGLENYIKTHEPKWKLKTAGENQALQPLSPEATEYKNHPIDSVFTEGLKGFGKGAVVGGTRPLNGATLGAVDWMDRNLLGGNITDFSKDIQQSADAAGAGVLNKAVNFGLDMAGNMVGAGGALVKGLGKTGLKGMKTASSAGGIEGLAYGVTGTDKLEDLPQNMALGGAFGAGMSAGMPYLLKPAAWAAKPVTNRVSRYIGKRNLIRQFKRGRDFEDVTLGNMDDDLVNNINQVRNMENVAPLDSSIISIPADRLEHIYEQRILGNKYSPDKTADVIYKALFSNNSKAIKGNYPQFQIVYDEVNPANTAVIGRHRNTGNVFVKTTMQKNARELGRFPTSSSNADGYATSSAARLSDLQAPYTNNIIPENLKVNPYEKRSFIEALANEEKVREMRPISVELSRAIVLYKI